MTLRVTATVTDISGGNQVTGVANKQISQTGTNKDGGRPSIGTSEETITVETDIGDLGYCVFVNRDSTNFVEIGIATATYFAKLFPGEAMVFPGAAAIGTFYLKADTAACDVEYQLFER